MSTTWAVEFRPQRFSEVAGQDHISTVLAPMVASANTGGRFPPALVLYGTRGTGKTTIARILAKALNCLDSVAGEPCNVCSTCRAITADSSTGVEEIDMATHGSVDAVRQITATSDFALAEDWRVWLLDEVHSASKEAFNALLKTLEEPPDRTVFLLLTTEPDRIPDTIRSRAMEFEFRRLPTRVLEERLRHIAGEKGEAGRIADEVYGLLATRAKGGMRDAVMSLEQVCYREGQITAETVGEVFGVSLLPQQVLDAALKGDLRRGQAVLADALASGSPPVPLVEALIDGLVAILGASAGAEPDPGGALEPDFVRSYAGTPAGTILAGLRLLWDARGRMSAASASAGATVSAAYALLVAALAPSVFAAPVAAPARTGPVRMGPPAPVRSRRVTAPELARLVEAARESPLTAESAQRLLS